MPPKRAFEKYKPQGLFSEFYGMLSLFTSFFITLQLLLLFIQNISPFAICSIITNRYLPYLEDVGNVQLN